MKVANLFFKEKPATGSKVTVIPLGVGIAPFDLKIIKAEKQRFGCNEREPYAWAVGLESITHHKFFEIAPLPNRREEVPGTEIISRLEAEDSEAAKLSYFARRSH